MQYKKTIMWGTAAICIICIIAVTLAYQSSDSKIVKTSQGAVRGYKDPEGGLYIFYGIPYATAPTGPRKFMPPLPPPVWLETLDAVDKRVICPQNNGLTEFMNAQEDCLIANVFVPDTEDTNLPVVVYVHGGAFQLGFGNLMTPKNLVKIKKVIVVTFNYRLGVHGFLCLGTKDIPGNAGLKDQLAALRWVKKNIIKFGGNPEDVTIAGYSAGATSVDILALSKNAAGLFKKVILDSGSILMAAAVVSDPLENAKTFAARSNFTNLEDVYALEDFYKNASFDVLLQDDEMDKTSTVLFGPCVERAGEGAILTDAPINILKNGEYQRVPMLYGFSNMEGRFREPYFDLWKNQMTVKFSDFLPGDLQFVNDHQMEEVAKEAHKFYFDGKPVNKENILSYIDYFGDVIFNYGVLRTVKMHVENGHDKVFLYQYSFVDEDVSVVMYTDVRGATHCAQTVAVLDGKTMGNPNETDITDTFKEMKIIMRELWTNFIKTGSPVPEDSPRPSWPHVESAGSPYMELALPPALGSDLLGGRARFWDRVYQRHYRAPIPPPQPPTRHSDL